MSHFFLLSLVLTLSLFADRPVCADPADASYAPCVGNVGIYTYSLHSLADATKGRDAIAIDDRSGNAFYYRPCMSVDTSGCGESGTDQVAVCMKEGAPDAPPPVFHSCGSTSNVMWLPRTTGDATGFILRFLDGADSRQTEIEFECNKDEEETGLFVAGQPSENPKDTFHLRWATKYACPASQGDGEKDDDDDEGGLAPGWIVFIIVTGLIAAYFVWGAVFKRLVWHRRGWEVIPNYSFWCAIPGAVAALYFFILSTICSLFSCGGYRLVSVQEVGMV